MIVQKVGAKGRSRTDGVRETFERHYPGLVRRLTVVLGDRASAEDIAQEAFLRLLRHGLPRGGDPGAWLHVVGTRLAYNHLRGESRRRRREQDWPAPVAVPPAGYEERQVVEEALAFLTPRERVALRLHAAGFSYAEIAAAIGARTGSMGTLLARATRRLRAHAQPGPGLVGPAPAAKGVEAP